MRRAAVFFGALAVAACGRGDDAPPAPQPRAPAPAAKPPPADDYAAARARMVKTQLAARGVADERVLAAMGRVPREKFVPDDMRALAYRDHPLPIGYEQTISQPYMVAIMTELAHVGPKSRVLEIGTGSGYQAAVLGEIVEQVYTIEIVEPLAKRSTELLERLGYDNVQVRLGDGYQGWIEHAPFDAIVVTAAPPAIPPPLKEQLAVGGRLVLPVGGQRQDLRVITRTADGFEEHSEFPVLFVPMTGEAQDPPATD